MAILATLPTGANLFSSPPPNPGLNEPLPANSPPPLPLPNRKKPPPTKLPPAAKPAALKATHSRSQYYKPVADGVIYGDGSGRVVVVGSSGVSYRLPGAPFEFQFSYSETPKAKPLAIREPAFLPFAPPTMNRPWTGKAPLLSKKDKERKKKIRLFEPLGGRPQKGYDDEEEEEGTKIMEMTRNVGHLGWYPKDERSREEILGEPLKRWEARAIIKSSLSGNRQVNLGRDGLTHNMLELIHTHWRRQQVCKVRCRGVPTVDMDNVCHHLEEKTGGKIIHRVGGFVYLFRGRNYNPRTRPRYPVMLWKPASPVYPKLIQEVPEGLTKSEAEELRKKGKNLLPICKLAKNGIYVNLVNDVRDAFEGSQLVKINCQGMHASDYKKLGAKLKELLPCVLLSFDDEQILMWRGKEWKSRYNTTLSSDPKLCKSKGGGFSGLNGSGQYSGYSSKCSLESKVQNPKMLFLWKRAVESCKALLLDNSELTPDALLKRVEEFEDVSQAAEHSYHALIMPSAEDPNDPESALEHKSGTNINDVYNDNDVTFRKEALDGDYECQVEVDVGNPFDENGPVPFGSLPVDSIPEQLSWD